MSAALTARLLSGRTPPPLLGRLLADTTMSGEVVGLDPDSGNEIGRADPRPAFIISSEGEASDSHILRQFWDLSRSADAGGVGIPVLWGHDLEQMRSLLGQWGGLGVRDVGGPKLIGRAGLDEELPDASMARGMIRRGTLRAVSVGWRPGAAIRRSELDRSDPLWRDAAEDECGQPAEGLVMGTDRAPNVMVEGSLISCPSDPAAVVTERLHRGVARDLAAAAPGLDLDRLLAVVATDSRVRAYVRAELMRIVRTELPLALRGMLPSLPATPTPARLVSDLLRSHHG